MDQLPSHGEKREHIVAFVLQKIVEGDFAPGARLTTKQIAESLHVSLTPVREAFAELAGLGVIDLQPNRGATIHSFTQREIQDVCRVRRALECEAIRGAVLRIPKTVIFQLDSAFLELAAGPIKGKESTPLARELDSQLHDSIALYCGNEFLYRELQRLSKLFRSFRDASWADSESRLDCDRLQEEAKEHAQITAALLARDKKQAVRAMGQHITASSKYWTRGIVYSDRK
jgi:DNA-binding GntR family transcriptional regulator